MFNRSTIRKGIKVNNKIDLDALELILDKKFFGFTKDIRILFTYASPITSPYTRSRENAVLEKIETYIEESRNSFLVIGDLNGKTRTEEDYVKDNDDKHSPICGIPSYVIVNQGERNSRDKHAIDEQGKTILELCKSHS